MTNHKINKKSQILVVFAFFYSFQVLIKAKCVKRPKESNEEDYCWAQMEAQFLVCSFSHPLDLLLLG